MSTFVFDALPHTKIQEQPSINFIVVLDKDILRIKESKIECNYSSLFEQRRENSIKKKK